MIRFILVAATILLYLILSIPVLIFESVIGSKNRRLRDERSISKVRWVFKIILFFAGVKITVKGKEKIPDDQAVLYVGNHRSYFDILVGYTTVPGLVGFVAKKEMKKIPLLSNWMEYVNCLFLDRKNLKEGLKTILQGIEQVKSGISVWIFPEGTRNKNEDIMELLPFKEGSLKIAEKSGCPVVPVAITGTAEVFEKHLPFIRSSKVTIEFGEPFLVKELPPEHKKFPGAYVKKEIERILEEELSFQGKLTGR
ncbi:MAG: 1-acyl-sn-glycerol-3-phosphate acyltransferase [Lacrimispora sp.]|nr:1-acyl-sn-glycerol-3-phosphate acyltransferase [Lacrimispora sp.]